MTLLSLWPSASPASTLEPYKPLMGYSHSSWGIPEGLPQISAQAVAQTPDGHLWVGTLEGLARFDGDRFTVFDRESSPPLPDNDVDVLYVAKDGTLWVGLYTGGLVAFKDGVFRAYGQGEGLPPVQILSLAEDGEGNLWIGTGGSGALRLTNGRFQAITTKEGLSNNGVDALLPDGSGGLWIGSVAGLDRFADGHIRHYRARRFDDSSVTALARDDHGLWVGTTRGLFRLEGDQPLRAEDRYALSSPSIQALIVDRAGSLWVGTENGLDCIRDGTVTHLGTRDGLSDSSIMSLFEDMEGDLWVGTLTGGLDHLHKGPITAYTSGQGLSSNIVETVLRARSGGMWIGGPSVDLLEGGRIRVLGSPGDLGRSLVEALFEDSKGRLWAGNATGLHCLEAGHWSHYTPREGLPRGDVRAVLEDRRGRLWVGTDGGGLACLEKGRLTVLTARDGLAGDRIRALLEDETGTLWIGTYGGVSAFAHGRFTNYTTSGGLSHNLIHVLHADPDGAIWIGTYGGGLNRLKDGRITALTTRGGLFQDVVEAVLDDGRGRLWMISNKGVFFISRADFEEYAAGRLARVTSIAYGVADGMPSAEGNGGAPAGAVGSDGLLYFATPKGLVVIDPTLAGRVHTIRAPIVEGAWLNGQSVPLSGGVDAPPGKSRLAFRYTAVALSNASRLNFSYRLEGFETDWVDAGLARQTQYTNVPPGNYRFVVRVREGSGPWTEPGPGVAVRIPAVWYRSGKVQLAALVGFAALAGAVVQLRIRGLRARELELSRKVEEALGELRMLSGLLPICSSCKKIRDDGGAWHAVEAYVRDHSEAEFTHGICPDCIEKLYPDAAKRLRERAAKISG